ncbi:hypothetical protein HK405_006329, partial [Cladochytrium tenue]
MGGGGAADNGAAAAAARPTRLGGAPAAVSITTNAARVDGTGASSSSSSSGSSTTGGPAALGGVGGSKLPPQLVFGPQVLSSSPLLPSAYLNLHLQRTSTVNSHGSRSSSSSSSSTSTGGPVVTPVRTTSISAIAAAAAEASNGATVWPALGAPTLPPKPKAVRFADVASAVDGGSPRSSVDGSTPPASLDLAPPRPFYSRALSSILGPALAAATATASGSPAPSPSPSVTPVPAAVTTAATQRAPVRSALARRSHALFPYTLDLRAVRELARQAPALSFRSALNCGDTTRPLPRGLLSSKAGSSLPVAVVHGLDSGDAANALVRVRFADSVTVWVNAYFSHTLRLTVADLIRMLHSARVKEADSSGTDVGSLEYLERFLGLASWEELTDRLAATLINSIEHPLNAELVRSINGPAFIFRIGNLFNAECHKDVAILLSSFARLRPGGIAFVLNTSFHTAEMPVPVARHDVPRVGRDKTINVVARCMGDTGLRRADLWWMLLELAGRDTNVELSLLCARLRRRFRATRGITGDAASAAAALRQISADEFRTMVLEDEAEFWARVDLEPGEGSREIDAALADLIRTDDGGRTVGIFTMCCLLACSGATVSARYLAHAILTDDFRDQCSAAKPGLDAQGRLQDQSVYQARSLLDLFPVATQPLSPPTKRRPLPTVPPMGVADVESLVLTVFRDMRERALIVADEADESKFSVPPAVFSSVLRGFLPGASAHFSRVGGVMGDWATVRERGGRLSLKVGDCVVRVLLLGGLGDVGLGGLGVRARPPPPPPSLTSSADSNAEQFLDSLVPTEDVARLLVVAIEAMSLSKAWRNDKSLTLGLVALLISHIQLLERMRGQPLIPPALDSARLSTKDYFALSLHAAAMHGNASALTALILSGAASATVPFPVPPQDVRAPGADDHSGTSAPQPPPPTRWPWWMQVLRSSYARQPDAARHIPAEALASLVAAPSQVFGQAGRPPSRDTLTPLMAAVANGQIRTARALLLLGRVDADTGSFVPGADPFPGSASSSTSTSARTAAAETGTAANAGAASGFSAFSRLFTRTKSLTDGVPVMHTPNATGGAESSSRAEIEGTEATGTPEDVPAATTGTLRSLAKESETALPPHTSLVHIAAFLGSEPLMRLLLDSGADPNAQMELTLECAFHILVRRGYRWLIARVLDQGDEGAQGGPWTLRERRDEWEGAMWVLRRSGAWPRLWDRTGMSPLHVATVLDEDLPWRLPAEEAGGSSSAVEGFDPPDNSLDPTPLQTLLRMHFPLDVTDAAGRTPLHVAAELGHVHATHVVLARAAAMREAALESAGTHAGGGGGGLGRRRSGAAGSAAAAMRPTRLRERRFQLTPLHVAIRFGHAVVAEILCAADVEAVRACDDREFLEAAAGGQQAAAAGGPNHAPSGSGGRSPLLMPPLHTATLCNRPGIIAALLDAGADPDLLFPVSVAALVQQLNEARMPAAGSQGAQVPSSGSSVGGGTAGGGSPEVGALHVAAGLPDEFPEALEALLAWQPQQQRDAEGGGGG